jgi:ankyrin repeat protein
MGGGWNAMHVACLNGNTMTAQLLLQAQPSAAVLLTSDGASPHSIAWDHGHSELSALLPVLETNEDGVGADDTKDEDEDDME